MNATAALAASSPTWFDTPAKIAALRAVASEWVGTPFFANSEACGRDGGVDCIHLLHAIYTRLGVLPRLVIPPQVMDWGDHADRSRLVEALETWAELTHRFVCLPVNTAPLPGDLLVFNGGRVPHHGGLMLDVGEFLHALKPEGVYAMQLGAAVRGWRVLGHLAGIYRPRAEHAILS